jgi:hypothetical protein
LIPSPQLIYTLPKIYIYWLRTSNPKAHGGGGVREVTRQSEKLWLQTLLSTSPRFDTEFCRDWVSKTRVDITTSTSLCRWKDFEAIQQRSVVEIGFSKYFVSICAQNIGITRDVVCH